MLCCLFNPKPQFPTSPWKQWAVHQRSTVASTLTAWRAESKEETESTSLLTEKLPADDSYWVVYPWLSVESWLRNNFSCPKYWMSWHRLYICIYGSLFIWPIHHLCCLKLYWLFSVFVTDFCSHGTKACRGADTECSSTESFLSIRITISSPSLE